MPHDPKVSPIMRGRLVLVAERYGTPRVLATGTVRHLGYPAKAFATAADVLAFLRLHRNGVQCLLTDLLLPDMHGRELIERARVIVPGLRVVLMVAPDQPSYRDLPFLTKPVLRDRLAETLQELLGPPEHDPGSPPSMGRPRARRLRSGRHEA
jgi:CheY-like chemotaxis protein